MKKTFVIPANFIESGYVLNGAVSVRNMIEGGIIALLMFFVCKLLPLPSGVDGISYYILIIGPFALLGISGIQGDPLSVFVLNYFRWRKRRNPYFYNPHGEAYLQEAADYLLDAPQIRDMLVDAVEKLRSKSDGEAIDYVEGKTFQFAVDPEQEALRQALEDLEAKREEELAKELEFAEFADEDTPPAVNPFEQPESAVPVDTQKLLRQLVLDDLGMEEDEADGPQG